MRRFLLSPLFLAAALGSVAQAAPAVPAPAFNPPDTATSETAILSGGCFWGVQGVYEHVKGVTKAVAGYTGGAASTAQYEIVSTGTTGHAESVRITFNPQVISYGEILQIYFAVTTNPTELNYQGPDHGTQYRGVIWTETPEQTQIATRYIAQLTAAHAFSAPIVTKVEAALPFYPAETYHQDFLVRHPDNPYIVYNDIPKVEALQTQFPTLYRADPATVLKGVAP
ncbi:MAG: peptide-methionine (S)-S-oxide reductase MsrA [Proteobacteria bacterium]|nr:peptide-methionine (S)-S-oxide reductase MsrA [Pseudomonadota bacterium]MBU6424869.1 peptide-methionine (S)-S-oxide reductase MsrA [Rhodospirillales bacterium]